MDQLFYTREVTRSGPVWRLPTRESAPDFRYNAGGGSYAVPRSSQIAPLRNALLILKHGVVVYEQYRNLTDDRTRFISSPWRSPSPRC